MTDDNPLETFRHALAGATRAIAADPEVELSLTSDAPAVTGKSVKAPMPGRTLSAKEVAEARGFADAAALRLRHHNPRLHARGAPADEIARAVFDAAEQARCEALGARSMAGVRGNLASLTDYRLRTDPLTRARNREEVPLASAIGLMVRERLTGEAPPEEALSGLRLVSEWIEDKAGADLDALGLALDDQAAFAALVGKLLRDLELIEGETLALCAETYFAQSEQVPTRVRLAVGELTLPPRPGGLPERDVLERPLEQPTVAMDPPPSPSAPRPSTPSPWTASGWSATSSSR